MIKKIWIKSRVFLFIILLALSVRIFLVEIYLVPSGSMERTLLPGDIILVSKWQYGPRISVGNGSNYHRLGKLKKIRHNDVVVFNFPRADTILSSHPEDNFYKWAYEKKEKRAELVNSDQVIYQPVNHRQPYIKRCIALPGDTFEMHDGIVFINGKPAEIPKSIIPRTRWTMSEAEKNNRRSPHHLNTKNSLKFWKDALAYRSIFPNSFVYRWSHDVYGPIVIPKKGVTVALDYTNIWLYKRIIEAYEHNQLTINENGIFINGRKETSYTFRMNYYFMLGDNRPGSNDSMFWGFVPEDHIIGKAILILFSSGEKEKDEKGIRWRRLFKSII